MVSSNFEITRPRGKGAPRKEEEKVVSVERLTSTERAKVLDLAESLAERERISSVAAYGPKVAGYVGDSSNYDIIVVVKDFGERAKYPPHKDPVQSSALLVDETDLLADARRAALGESVVGRLLNVYEPVLNPELLRSAEFDYKKRVTAEELIVLQSEYGRFATNLIVPHEFFLFMRLHERGLLAPDEVSDYAHTYTGTLREPNIEFALRTFREAARSLASDGLIESTDDDSVSLLRGKRGREALSKLLRAFPLTKRAAFRYTVHGIAGRLGLEVKTKPLAMLSVSGGSDLPVELERPKKLLRLEEGVVFDDPGRTIEELARLSGFKENYQYKEEKKGDLINSTRKLVIWSDENRASFILKRFAELKSAKWAILDIWALAAKHFNMSPLSRLSREVEAEKRLHRLGIKTHHIVGVVLDERTLVTEFVEGEPLDKTLNEILSGKSTDTSRIEAYGRVLGKLHKNGIVYGDTKPENALVSKDGPIALLDLEQCVEKGDAGWDLAEFLYFSAKLSPKRGEMKLVAEAFLKGYVTENGTHNIAKAKSPRYLLPFLPILTPSMISAIRSTLEQYSRGETMPESDAPH